MRKEIMLDTRGLACPLPLLKLKQALQSMEAGECVCVLATDPASTLDFGVFAEQMGHRIVEQDADGGEYRFLIEKAGKASGSSATTSG